MTRRWICHVLASTLPPLVAFIVVAAVANYFAERNSCLRQAPVREAANQRKAVVDLMARYPNPSMPAGDRAKLERLRVHIPTLRHLDCGLPWPDTR